jgi:hypothetical protein
MTKLNRRVFLKSAFVAAAALGTRRAYAQQSENVIYVNSIDGNDANDGLTPSQAKLSLEGARLALEGRGTIRVHAPTTHPVAGYVEFSSGQITIEGMNSASTWYCERGVTTILPGAEWEDHGDGIFSHPLAESSGVMWVSALDRAGFLTKLPINSANPTAPDVGEIGYADDLIYVHLTGDRNPADFTFKRNGVGYLIRALGDAQLTLRNGIFRHAVGSAIELASEDARLECEACAVQYSGIGFGASAAGELVCIGCFGQRNTLSAFNIAFSTTLLENCDGSYNDGEGVLAHQTANLTILGGRYHHNGSGGVTALHQAVVHLTSVEVDHNGRNGTGELKRGGLIFADTANGSVTDCHTHDNEGEGFYCATAGEVEVNGLTSENNTLDDVMC